MHLVLETLLKKMEEVKVRLQGNVVLYHVMLIPSLKSFGVVHCNWIMCFLPKRLLAMVKGKCSYDEVDWVV